MVTETGVWGANAHGEEIVIPVLGLTGEFQSGKTLFGLSIAPGGNRTRCYDFELSAAGYRGLGFDYVDANAKLREMFGKREYRPIDMFKWWLNDIQSIEVGIYSVIMIDPITDIESGLVDYVASEYAQYGFASEAKFVAMGGVFWGRVKEYWKRVLADLATRCETFAFTAHLNNIWINGKPTRKRKPGGKTTLTELASLYLWLDRTADKNGKVSEQPRCKLKLKDRLSYASVDPETMEPVIHPYLPPAFDACTPGAIRKYLASPADYKKLKVGERIKEDVVTETEKLEIEREIAESRASAEGSALERLRRQGELQAIAQKERDNRPANVDQSAEVNKQAEERTSDEVSAAEAKEVSEKSEPASEPQLSGCTPEQASELVALKDRLGLTLERFQAGIKKHAGGSVNPLDLTAEKASKIILQLTEAAEKQGK